MTDKTCRIVMTIPNQNREIDASVVLADLARKLRSVGSLPAGVHEILIFADGSVVLNAALVWEPKASAVATPQMKAG